MRFPPLWRISACAALLGLGQNGLRIGRYIQRLPDQRARHQHLVAAPIEINSKLEKNIRQFLVQYIR